MFRSATALLVLQGVPFRYLNFTTVRFLYRIIVLGYKLFRSATALLVLQGVPFRNLNFTTVRFFYRIIV